MNTTTSRIQLEDALDHRIKHNTIDAEGIRMLRRSIQLLKQRERFERVSEVFAPLVKTFGTR